VKPDGTVQLCIIFPKSALDDIVITNIGVEVKELIQDSVYNASRQYPIVGNLEFFYGPSNSSKYSFYQNMNVLKVDMCLAVVNYDTIWRKVRLSSFPGFSSVDNFLKTSY